MTKEELMDFMEWYAGDETMSNQRTKDLEQIVDIYLSTDTTPRKFRWDRFAIMILSPVVCAGLIYLNHKLFPPDSIFSWWYWLDLKY